MSCVVFKRCCCICAFWFDTIVFRKRSLTYICSTVIHVEYCHTSGALSCIWRTIVHLEQCHVSGALSYIWSNNAFQTTFASSRSRQNELGRLVFLLAAIFPNDILKSL